MKLSLCQMIAIVCILAVGFLTVAPIVQTAEAHGKKHKYKVPVKIIAMTYCEGCEYFVSSEKLGESEITLIHSDGGSHATSATTYVNYYDGWCGECYYC